MALSVTNADGRYYWFGNAEGVTGGQINFVGNLANLAGIAALTWTIMQRAGDASYPVVTYSTHADGSSPVSQQVGSEGTPQQVINESGVIKVNLAGATGFSINVPSGGGVANPTAVQWVLALAITRNSDETLPWDAPNPFDPAAYNFTEPPDMEGDQNTDTLASLRTRLLTDLGFATQAANPPSGMASY